MYYGYEKMSNDVVHCTGSPLALFVRDKLGLGLEDLYYFKVIDVDSDDECIYAYFYRVYVGCPDDESTFFCTVVSHGDNFDSFDLLYIDKVKRYVVDHGICKSMGYSDDFKCEESSCIFRFFVDYLDFDLIDMAVNTGISLAALKKLYYGQTTIDSMKFRSVKYICSHMGISLWYFL